ncbi:MAG TPA: hypothetical protein VHE79_04895, partial [Spirochaetia bacterium]
MAFTSDGPGSPLFAPLALRVEGETATGGSAGVSDGLRGALAGAPRGEHAFRGIPFVLGEPLVVTGRSTRVNVERTEARWLVFLHVADSVPLEAGPDGLVSPMRGEGRLGERLCTYRVRYGDGTDTVLPVRGRFHVGSFTRRWGENCFEAVPHRKPRTVRPPHEQLRGEWGSSQTRVRAGDEEGALFWLWAWENPRSGAPIVAIDLEPGTIPVALLGVSAGSVSTHPLRWGTRRKALLTLPPGVSFPFDVDDGGQLVGIRLDLGQVISAQRRPLYPDGRWEESFNNEVPAVSQTEVIVEYTAHPEAVFHVGGPA